MIESGICWSFKSELLLAIHDFENDDIALALYGSTANLSCATTTAYTPTGECDDDDYSAGGMIVSHNVVSDGGTVKVVFEDVVFEGDITARGALLYNYSQSDRAIAVLNFGMDRSSVDGVFTVRFPKFHDIGNLIAIK
jgi:hypothetical protein